MKSAVETLSPTRAKLTVEVPFEELKPSLDAAYQQIAKQSTPARGCSSMVEPQSSKLATRVRFPSSALLGVWRSLVARLLWEQEAPGSNPGTPTTSARPDGI